MTLLEKIEQGGGFADFGMNGSMPWGVYPNIDGMDGVASRQEYYDIMKLKAEGKIIEAGKYPAGNHQHSSWCKGSGRLYKVKK